MPTTVRLFATVVASLLGPVVGTAGGDLDTAAGFLEALQENETLLDAIAFQSDFTSTTGLGPDQRDARASQGQTAITLFDDRFRVETEFVASGMPPSEGTYYRRGDTRYDGERVESYLIFGETNHDDIPIERFRADPAERPGIKWDETWYVQWADESDDLDVNGPGRPFPLFGALGHGEGYRLTDLIADLTHDSASLDAPCVTGFANAVARRFWGDHADLRVWLDPEQSNRLVGLEMEIRSGATNQRVAAMRLELRSIAFDYVDGQLVPVRGQYTVVRPTPFGAQRGRSFSPRNGLWNSVRVRLSGISLEHGRGIDYFRHAIPEGTVLDSPWGRLWIAQADGHTLERAPESVDTIVRTIKREARSARERFPIERRGQPFSREGRSDLGFGDRVTVSGVQHDASEGDLPCTVRCALAAASFISPEGRVPDVDTDTLNAMRLDADLSEGVLDFLRRQGYSPTSTTRARLAALRPSPEEPVLLEVNAEWPKRGAPGQQLTGVDYGDGAPHHILAFGREGTAFHIWDVTVAQESIPLSELEPYFTGRIVSLKPQPAWMRAVRKMAGRNDIRLGGAAVLILGGFVTVVQYRRTRREYAGAGA